jgi:hypothetical protein
LKWENHLNFTNLRPSWEIASKNKTKLVMFKGRNVQRHLEMLGSSLKYILLNTTTFLCRPPDLYIIYITSSEMIMIYYLMCLFGLLYDLTFCL